jgi:hypothetical protein
MPIVRSGDQFAAASRGTHLPLAAMVIGPGRPAAEMLAAGYALSVDPMSAQVLAYRAMRSGYEGIRTGAGFGMTAQDVLETVRDIGERSPSRRSTRSRPARPSGNLCPGSLNTLPSTCANLDQQGSLDLRAIAVPEV